MPSGVPVNESDVLPSSSETELAFAEPKAPAPLRLNPSSKMFFGSGYFANQSNHSSQHSIGSTPVDTPCLSPSSSSTSLPQSPSSDYLATPFASPIASPTQRFTSQFGEAVKVKWSAPAALTMRIDPLSPPRDSTPLDVVEEHKRPSHVPLPAPRASEDVYLSESDESSIRDLTIAVEEQASRRILPVHDSGVFPRSENASGEDVSSEEESKVEVALAIAEKDTRHRRTLQDRWDHLSQLSRAWIQRHYLVLQEPALVLPTAPSDTEKTSYLVTHRFLLCTVGIFGFLSASAGIWLFTVCAAPFYFFAVFASFIQFYLSVFYLTGCLSKNFDYAKHVKVLEDHAVTSPEDAPTVDIYLPCCKEPLEILENTYRHVVQMQYPEGRLKVHVLDDGALDSVQTLAAKYGFNYIRRDDRPRLKKAGNLRWAFARTDGEFFVIYDADFCPRSDFLLELIPRMKHDPNIAIIQTPQYFRTTKEQTWVERGAGSVQELFYRFIQTNRDKWGGAICVGSNAMYRREALIETGGTAEVGASEDVHTGFFAITRGWQLRYMPLNLACGVSPDTPRAFFSQQVRWCQGSTSLLLNREFWKSNLTWKQKGCYLSGMLYYSASALGLFTNPTPGIMLMWFRIQYLNYYNLFFAIPSILYGIVVFRLWSRSTHSLAVAQIGVIQQYAYLSALVDRVIGTSFDWVPSGDGNAHKSDRYRNYRLLAIGWTFTYQSLFIAACAYRMVLGHPWYSFFPLIILDCYQIYITAPYLLSP